MRGAAWPRRPFVARRDYCRDTAETFGVRERVGEDEGDGGPADASGGGTGLAAAHDRAAAFVGVVESPAVFARPRVGVRGVADDADDVLLGVELGAAASPVRDAIGYGRGRGLARSGRLQSASRCRGR